MAVGEGSTAVASDSTHFRAWDQNIFTEWHSRYRNGKRGVLIYWMVDKGGAMAVHSQLLECSASECTPWSRARCGTAPT
jgi:TnpA family transposase